MQTNEPSQPIRDNNWLEDMLADIWYRYFSDVPQKNDVKIKFGRPARTRLGSIKWGRKPVAHKDGNPRKRSIITITGYFKHQDIPEDVVRAVVAHELVHYGHGFSSPLPQLHSHPHKGGIVDKELVARGLKAELEFEKSWMKKNWVAFVKKWHVEHKIPLYRKPRTHRHPHFRRKKSLWQILGF